ncbi:DMT family transporter [Cyclobacterium jeungdonense]|uniref:DMT family transporter n=1 Tax=Cyclobacterium jeungdonense TaxID=708087 RepID=A0ABT8CAT8_9BACT|nr:DMT family transporter [Cyclobacterium jeungdonense]MDN3689511.1 DMT family transporter [Cyclobacterium jeungdonense]
MKRTTLIIAAGFVLLWNSGFIGAVYGLPYTGPFTLVFWRYLALTLVIVLYLLLRQRFRWVGWKVASPHMLIGILAHGLWLTCVLLALDNQVPAGIVALIVALQPLATGALSGLVVAGEQANSYQWLGLVLGFFGVVLTVAFRIDFGSYTSVFGYLIPLGSVIGMTAASLIQRRMEVKKESKKLPVDLALFYQSLATTLTLALPAIFIEKLSTRWEPEFIYALIWLIFAVSLGAYVLMWLLIERIEATRVASLFYLGPPVTMLMAWLAFGDMVQPMDIAGLAIVFVGVFLSQVNTKNP